jgi:benzoate-CoA ligase family protein
LHHIASVERGNDVELLRQLDAAIQLPSVSAMSERFNAADYLVDRHLANGDGDRVAVVSEGRSTSYLELAELSRAFAGGLADLGVHRGDRVMFVCSDRTELVAGILGAFRLGAVATPVSTMLTGFELAKIVTDSCARVLVVSQEFAHPASVAVTQSPDVTHVITVTDVELDVPEHVTVAGWDSVLDAGRSVAAASAWGDAATTGESPALWLYTSGTTGMPKAAMHRHENLRAVCEAYARDVLRTGADDRFLSMAKLFFAYGFGNSLLFPLAAGGTAVLESRRPSGDVVAERIREDAPTLFFAGPTFFAALLATDLPDDTFRGVRLCVSAGETLPATLYRRFVARFGVVILDGIGSTEALHIFASNREGMVRPGTTGTPVAGYDLAIRDGEGQPVPDGEPGVLYVRGASLANGYWCRTDATRAVFQGEWLCTGDTYVRSEDGYFSCLGRTNDMLKAGGIWVSPTEVEERLLQHAGVAEAAVVGVADSNELDKPVAFVVPVAGTDPTEAELVAWCRDGLAAFKRPRAVVMVSELPKTATGKVQRFRLRELAGSDVFGAVAP